MYTFARLQDCTDLNNAADFYYHVVIVFLSEYETDLFNKSLFVVDQQIENPDLNLKISNVGDNQVEKLINFQSNFQTRICNGSPFHFYFEKIFQEVLSTINSTQASKIRKCYFCSNIFNNTFIKKYLALFSLWSGVHLVHMTKTRDTNSHIENWFRILKNNTFKCDRVRPK